MKKFAFLSPVVLGPVLFTSVSISAETSTGGHSASNSSCINGHWPSAETVLRKLDSTSIG